MHRASGLTILIQSVKMVLRNVAANKMRTLLTCLGIFIGVGALIYMMTLYDIQKDDALEELYEKGTTTIDIDLYKSDSGSRPKGFMKSDIDYIRGIDHVVGVSELVSAYSTNLSYNKTNYKGTSVTGVTCEEYLYGKEKKLVKGRIFSQNEVDDKDCVCLICDNFAKKLFGNDPIGQKVILYGKRFTVVGTIKGKGDTPSTKYVTIPATTLSRETGEGVSELHVYADDIDNLNEVSEEINKYLKQINGIDYYNSFYQSEIDSALTDIKSAAALQLAIAGLSLLIGGIGIMNMMLISVSERTSEIGLRKALGAIPSRIQTQFILESIVISLLGGVGGTVLGIIMSLGYCLYYHYDPHVNTLSILFAVAFSVSVGVIFGWAPARSASKLDPIEAMKCE